ncbi:unnamed protein product [Rhizoctonia solani]|uniref:EF-hand domain-containing protein n=1 Tax=Rhizoctonia solani TaxID=456999 RepID=A0A8H3DZJ2_9AGAM|nr:unnamed protein product [Rhizoctonia solani]
METSGYVSKLNDIECSALPRGARSSIGVPRSRATATLFTPTITTDGGSLELREAFQIFDKNGDGQIATTELASLLHALSTPIHDVETIIAQADANEDGALDLGEFLLLMGERLNSGQKTDRELRDIFERFDKDGSGSIERAELGRAVALLGMFWASLNHWGWCVEGRVEEQILTSPIQ